MEIPGDDLGPIYALNPHQQLTYWTGAIAQNDVALEMTIFRMAGDALCLPTMARADLPRDFERLREAVKDLVKESRLPPELKLKAAATLGRAKVVHRARVELVHDSWGLLEGSDPPSFAVMDALMGREWPDTPPKPRTLPEFEQAARAHIAMIHEISVISMAMSRFYSDEATARFVATQIAIHLVGGPFDNQYRAASRTAGGAPPDFYDEAGALYQRGFETLEQHEQADYNYLGQTPRSS